MKNLIISSTFIIIGAFSSITYANTNIDMESIARAATVIAEGSIAQNNSKELKQVKADIKKINSSLNILKSIVLPINESALLDMRDFIKDKNLRLKVWVGDSVLNMSDESKTAVNRVIQTCFNKVLERVDKDDLKFSQLYFSEGHTGVSGKFEVSRAYDMPGKNYMSDTLYMRVGTAGDIPSANDCVKTIIGQGIN